MTILSGYRIEDWEPVINQWWPSERLAKGQVTYLYSK